MARPERDTGKQQAAAQSEAGRPVYGLRGITHGGGVWIALIADDDAAALRQRIDTPPGLAADADDGGPLRYLEITAGALDELVRRNGILELDYARWQAKKRELARSPNRPENRKPRRAVEAGFSPRTTG